MADPRSHLADLRFAMSAIESASELLHCNEAHDDRRFAKFCRGTSADARTLAKKIRKKVSSLEK